MLGALGGVRPSPREKGDQRRRESFKPRIGEIAIDVEPFPSHTASCIA